jgi:hypothetical protein
MERHIRPSPELLKAGPQYVWLSVASDPQRHAYITSLATCYFISIFCFLMGFMAGRPRAPSVSWLAAVFDRDDDAVVVGVLL